MKKIVSILLILALCMTMEVAKADFIFGEPTNLGPPVNSQYYEDSVNISADGLALYFISPRPGGPDDFDLFDIYVTTRSDKNANWSEPENLGLTVNSANNDAGPSISADGMSLYFSSTRTGGHGDDDLWVTTRSTVSDSWGPPVNLGSTVNSPSWDFDPSISANGLSVYFTSNRPGSYGFVDIWVTTRATTEEDWSEPVNLGPVVNSTTFTQAPSISADGLVLFFESDRPGGVGHNDIWMTRRATTDDPWGEPVSFGPHVNSPGYEKMPDVSADGRTLYFGHFDEADGPWDLWQVSIDPVVDLNSDGIVDGADLSIIADHWGTDDSLCDIGPMPWGDGVVDVQDLIVIAEYLSPAGPEEVNVNEENDGGQIELEQGQILVVTLESNPTTGYSWQQAENQEPYLEQMGQPDFKQSLTGGPPIAGAGGWEIFRFKAISAGQMTLQLVYRRPWEEGVEPVNTFSLDVVIH
ncbi:MAG: protease inhibitor I42 family protein [Planctomycetota bacterium]|jgi:predicted secreted protein